MDVVGAEGAKSCLLHGRDNRMLGTKKLQGEKCMLQGLGPIFKIGPKPCSPSSMDACSVADQRPGFLLLGNALDIFVDLTEVRNNLAKPLVFKDGYRLIDSHPLRVSIAFPHLLSLLSSCYTSGSVPAVVSPA